MHSAFCFLNVRLRSPMTSFSSARSAIWHKPSLENVTSVFAGIRHQWTFLDRCTLVPPHASFSNRAILNIYFAPMWSDAAGLLSVDLLVDWFLTGISGMSSEYWDELLSSANADRGSLICCSIVYSTGESHRKISNTFTLFKLCNT
jgi:hypothetical protein